MTNTKRTLPTQSVQGDGHRVTCQHCGERVKLNEIVRSAHHELGCAYCYGK